MPSGKSWVGISKVWLTEGVEQKRFKWDCITVKIKLEDVFQERVSVINLNGYMINCIEVLILQDPLLKMYEKNSYCKEETGNAFLL